jgi:archaellum component FlaF (FlaF/FlaG flagellin family)
MVSDLSLNGKLDVAVPATDGSAAGVDVFWGNGDGTLEPAQFFGATASGPGVIGDFNGDHLPDFAFGETTYGVTTMLNTGVVSFSPSTAPLTFPVQLIDTTSSKQTVNLTNNGTTALSISSIKLSGEFQMSDTCGRSVASGSSCSISAVFKPKSAGNFTGLITIIDSASSKPQFVELAGSATAVKVAPAALRFGDQKVGTASSAQTVTATNEGSTAITFSSVGLGRTAEKNFTATENCTGHAIQPGASCSASVTFDPTQTGAVSGELFFTLPTSSISPAPVVLSGTGT